MRAPNGEVERILALTALFLGLRQATCYATLTFFYDPLRSSRRMRLWIIQH